MKHINILLTTICLLTVNSAQAGFFTEVHTSDLKSSVDCNQLVVPADALSIFKKFGFAPESYAKIDDLKFDFFSFNSSLKELPSLLMTGGGSLGGRVYHSAPSDKNIDSALKSLDKTHIVMDIAYAHEFGNFHSSIVDLYSVNKVDIQGSKVDLNTGNNRTKGWGLINATDIDSMTTGLAFGSNIKDVKQALKRATTIFIKEFCSK